MATQEFVTEHGKVTSDGSWQYWQLNGVKDVQVQAVSPTVHAQIQALVDKYRAEYVQEVKNAEEAQRQQAIRAREAFVKKVLADIQGTAAYKMLVSKGFDLATNREQRRFTVQGKFGNHVLYSTIEYDPKVYSGWGSHSTEACWKVEYDYKTKDRAVRFKDIGKALLTAVNRVNAKVEQARFAAECAAKRATLSSVAQEQLGAEFKVERRSVYSRSSDRTSEQVRASAHIAYSESSKAGLRATVTTVGAIDSENKQPVFTDVKLDGNFTAEQLQRLFALVREMRPAGVYVSSYD
jgi:hypothetical protein